MVQNIQEIKNPGGSKHFEQLVGKCLGLLVRSHSICTSQASWTFVIPLPNIPRPALCYFDIQVIAVTKFVTEWQMYDNRTFFRLPSGCSREFTLRSLLELSFLAARWPQPSSFPAFWQLRWPPSWFDISCLDLKKGAAGMKIDDFTLSSWGKSRDQSRPLISPFPAQFTSSDLPIHCTSTLIFSTARCSRFLKD